MLLVAACGGSSTTPAPGLTGSITVSAAASLTDVLQQIAEAFKLSNPDATITFNLDSSTTLSQQILDGAPVDVFASADEANMTKLSDANLVAGKPMIIATNEMAIVVKSGNPAQVQTVADLAAVDVVSLCGEEVPCGRFAQQVLDKAGVTIPASKITRGTNVRATIAAVSEGDADAAIVYATDVAGEGDAVDAVPIPAELNVVAAYPMATLVATGNRQLADTFVEFVASDDGQQILAAAGFRPP
jgi:molybdate transport system substrate-binding protein